MPGNLIVINRRLTWYVGDSRMEELIEFLHKVGFQEQPEEPETVPVITTDLCKKCDKLRILSVEDRLIT